MGQPPMVVLGVPGEMVPADDEVSHYTTKVGGTARFPGGVEPALARTMACGVCGEPMALVVQARTAGQRAALVRDSQSDTPPASKFERCSIWCTCFFFTSAKTEGNSRKSCVAGGERQKM